MRIVQTFWTAGQDPLKHAFGWLHPEYNLMSWALSCLSLREHYDEVALYTDSEGKRILIDELHLPYTEVNVVFDDFPCLPQHWALAKIKTYSLQTKPFLHVDGDVYVSQPFSEEILTAPLVAQNREIGTGYYRQMIDDLLIHEELIIPDHIKKVISKESISSYNMGVFGGNDLYSIHSYCKEVFSFIERNRMNDIRCSNSGISCNVFFEQIWLAAWSETNNKEVSGLINHPVMDNGYTIHEFCDLDRYENNRCFHLLGGHKKNKEVISMLERALIRFFPDIYLHILYFFPEKHFRLSLSNPIYATWLSAEQSLAQYVDFLAVQEEKWRSLNTEEIFLLERKAANSVYFLKLPKEERNICMLERNPYLSLFEIPQDWNPWTKEQIWDRLSHEGKKQFNMIAITPSMAQKGIKETALSAVCKIMLNILDGVVLTYEEFQDKLILMLGINKNNTVQDCITDCFCTEFKNLINNGIIIIKKSK